MNVAQFDINQDFIVQANLPLPNPSFFAQAFTPWNNVSQSGYDRSVYIHGIVFNLEVALLSHAVDQGNFTPGLPAGARAFMPFATWWYVDAAEPATQAPVSLTQQPYGPFQSTPPISAPGAAQGDSDLLPTRIIRRKFGLMKASLINNSANLARDIDVDGFSRFRWSGTIRKRFAVDGRQGLYFTAFAVSPIVNVDYACTVWLNGHFYYTIKR